MIDAKEFRRRRNRLMDMMGSDSVALLPAATRRRRNRDVDYPYRPDSDFLYLTGFPEPDALAVLLPDHPEHEYVLFCRARDPKAELWDGCRAGLEGAREQYAADCSHSIQDIDRVLPELLANRERIYYQMGEHSDFDQRVLGWLSRVRNRARSGVQAPSEFISLGYLLHEMRLYKSRHEIKVMRQAARISAAAHRRAMRACRPGMMEYQLEAELVHEFMSQGARAAAYPSIVGSGSNACVLHYTANNAALQEGELVLIDAGAELDGYASDISRTFPVSGTFTAAQREIYELVLAAQEAAIAQAIAGNHWNAPHQAAVECITRGLLELGILKGRYGTLMRERAWDRYYMHRTGHWLGMDVHDVGDYQVDGEWRLFEPGMVLTVEPGLYLSRRLPRLAKRWWDIGVRIEDDVLITRNGNDVLSKGVVKAPDDVELWMADAG